ncbi:MAG: FRG domain-containing protein [Bacteroidota bacterium]
MKSIKVKDWNDLNDKLFADTWDKDIKRHRSTFAYRGASKSEWKIQNGLSRIGTPYPNLENNLIKQFKKYGHTLVAEKETEWHWLSVAQHHGLPTRLIDWTYSPLIALHFATEDTSCFEEDGAVWKVNYSHVHDLLQSKQTAELKKLGARIFNVGALAATIPNLEELDKLHAQNFDVAVFFEPPGINDRIVNQFAYFSALSDPFMTMDTWFQKPYVKGSVDATKIIIPHDLKWEIRDKLDQSNVNERVLFPGLDGLCSWLKRHYMPAS